MSYHVQYIGEDIELIGQTALALEEPFRVQIDDFEHPWSHCWTEQDRTLWAPTSHILIQNQNELPIWGLRLLGLSQKNEEQIGQFGTGLKEAIALLCRLDSLPIVYSGTCRITFKVMHDPQEIGFILSEPRAQYEANVWHGLGINPGFGKADWTDTWMAFREIVCNAIDEGGLYHDVVTTMSGVEGATRFYLPSNRNMMATYSDLDDKLMMLGNHKIIEVTPAGSILAKRKKSNLQLYHRGVWIQESDVESLYDYEMNTIKLNESRSADWYNVRSQLAGIMSTMSADEFLPIIKKTMNGDEFYERDMLQAMRSWMIIATGEGIRGAWLKAYGDGVACPNDKTTHDKIENRGRKPVIVKDETLFRVLKQAGVEIAENLVSPESLAIDSSSEASRELIEEFAEVWTAMQSVGITRGSVKPPLKSFTEASGASTRHGMYFGGVCYINSGSSAVERQIACVEEIAHHVTGANDMTREFQTYLTDSIKTLLFS